MSVNDKIRLIREAKGLTQEQVAEKLGICANSYGDIERGDNDPKLSKLQKIAEVFEIELPELVDLTDKGNLNVTFASYNKRKFYINSSNLELEKQLLINELKDKELAMKDREIAYLKKINELLQAEKK